MTINYQQKQKIEYCNIQLTNKYKLKIVVEILLNKDLCKEIVNNVNNYVRQPSTYPLFYSRLSIDVHNSHVDTHIIHRVIHKYTGYPRFLCA